MGTCTNTSINPAKNENKQITDTCVSYCLPYYSPEYQYSLLKHFLCMRKRAENKTNEKSTPIPIIHTQMQTLTDNLQ